MKNLGSAGKSSSRSFWSGGGSHKRGHGLCTMRLLHRCTSLVRPVPIWYWWKSCWIALESPSATLGPCSSCRRIFQSRLFIVNPVAGSPRSRSALLSLWISMSSIWYTWCPSECERCTAQGCSSVGVSTCWRSVKCRFLVRSIFRSLPLSGSKWSASGEVRLKARKSALAWGEDRSSCWSPKPKSESSTSLADSAVRNSSSVLGFFAGEDSLVVARCCLISSSFFLRFWLLNIHGFN